MAAALTNIFASTYTKTTGITLVDASLTSRSIKEVWYCNPSLLSTKIWELATESIVSVISSTASQSAIARYVAPSNMVVASFDMLSSHNPSTLSSNYAFGVYYEYAANGNIYGVPISSSTAQFSNSGCSIVDAGIHAGVQLYKHTKTFAIGSRPSLTAGSVYYFHIGPHYFTGTINYLGGTNTAYTILDWTCSGTSWIDGIKSGTSVLTGNQINNVYLNVVAG